MEGVEKLGKLQRCHRKPICTGTIPESKSRLIKAFMQQKIVSEQLPPVATIV